jgi:hypothetical protein
LHVETWDFDGRRVDHPCFSQETRLPGFQSSVPWDLVHHPYCLHWYVWNEPRHMKHTLWVSEVSGDSCKDLLMTPQVDGAMKSAGKPKGEGPKHKRLEVDYGAWKLKHPL